MRTPFRSKQQVAYTAAAHLLDHQASAECSLLATRIRSPYLLLVQFPQDIIKTHVQGNFSPSKTDFSPSTQYWHSYGAFSTLNNVQ